MLADPGNPKTQALCLRAGRSSPSPYEKEIVPNPYLEVSICMLICSRLQVRVSPIRMETANSISNRLYEYHPASVPVLVAIIAL